MGEDHPDVASSLNNLAALYHSQGRYEKAEPRFLQALKIAEQALGKNHPNTNTIRGKTSEANGKNRFHMVLHFADP